MSDVLTSVADGLKEDLAAKLMGRVAIVGVGNREHGDDAAGPLVAQLLTEAGVPDVVDADVAPELETWRLREMQPDTVVFVDAVDFGGRPGDAALLEPADMRSDGCDTHRAPLKLTMLYLHEELGCRCCVLAIQPLSVRGGTRMCKHVSESAVRLAEILSETLAERG